MKRIIALFLTIPMMFALCACGGTSSEEVVVKADPEPVLAVPAAEPAEVVAEPPAFDFGSTGYSLEMPIYELVKETDLNETYEYSDFIYNEKGQVIEKKQSSKSADDIITYEYDEDGRIIKETETGHYGYDSSVYTYNEQGLVQREEYISDYAFYDGTVIDYEYTFDNKGRILEKKLINSNYPKDPTVISYEYDENDIIIEETETNYEGHSIDSQYISTFEYDSAGRLIRRLIYDVNDGKYWKPYEYEYAPVSFYTISTETDSSLRTTDNWVSFDELRALPMPDSCITNIEFFDSVNNGTAIIYTFVLPNSQTEANDTYHKYQLILSDICGFMLENSDDMVYIYQSGELVCAMMAGNDADLGYFLQMSFPSDKAASSGSSSTDSSTTSFTNKFGTATTRCVKSGCDNYIASSGDTNCCTAHSNRCLNCNCYIDGDAMYCMSCLTGASSSSKSSSSSGSSSKSNSSSGGCKYTYSNGSTCGAKCSSGMTLCDKHFNELNAIFESFGG